MPPRIRRTLLVLGVVLLCVALIAGVALLGSWMLGSLGWPTA